LPSFSLTKGCALGNVFEGILSNPYFYCIWIGTALCQVVIVQFGSVAFNVYEDGLPAKDWGISMAIGFGSLPVQQVINTIFSAAQTWNTRRNRHRVNRNAALTTQNLDGVSQRKKQN
jgi:P-type Ca2+ transporter type 2B